MAKLNSKRFKLIAKLIKDGNIKYAIRSDHKILHRYSDGRYILYREIKKGHIEKVINKFKEMGYSVERY